MLRRLLAATAVAAIALSAAVPGVLAAGPSRDYLATPDHIELAAGDACAFPIRVDFLVNREYGISFRDAAGAMERQLISGTLIIALTNELNGHSITVDISGPAEIVVHDDGGWTYILRGNSLPIVPGRLYLSTGTVVQQFDAGGTLLSTSAATGTETDLCPALA